MVSQIYPTELKLNNANHFIGHQCDFVFSDHTHFFEHIHNNGIVSSYIYDQQDDFKFKIDKFPFLDKYIPRSPSKLLLTERIRSLWELILSFKKSSHFENGQYCRESLLDTEVSL